LVEPLLMSDGTDEGAKWQLSGTRLDSQF